MQLIRFDDCTFIQNNQPLFSGFSWTLNPGEQWLISGPSGSGKTLFFEVLSGRYRLASGQFYYQGESGQKALESLRRKTACVYFKDAQMNASSNYYQQRYNSQDADDTLTVRNFLFEGVPGDEAAYFEILGFFHTVIPLDKEFIKLSNGENRKILIAKALLQRPEILILDNPYTGLDQSSRCDLNILIDRLIQSGLHILLASKQSSIPTSITHILSLENRKIKYAGPKVSFPVTTQIKEFSGLPFQFQPGENNHFKIAVRLKQVTIRYEDKILLNQVDFTIQRGEKWAIQGPNGSGKSLLASLIYADHPQSYVNDIILFDQPRGRGESIWTIKEKIGFLSPEFHFYFDQNQTARQVALSGLKDNPYRPKPVTRISEKMVADLFNYYQIPYLSGQPMYVLSAGFQRLILFIRVIVKNPPFLLLDEPFQNFDANTITLSKHLLDEFCKDRTMLFITHDEEEIPACVTNRFTMEKIL